MGGICGNEDGDKWCVGDCEEGDGSWGSWWWGIDVVVEEGGGGKNGEMGWGWFVGVGEGSGGRKV